MEVLSQPYQEYVTANSHYRTLAEENALLRREIQVAHKAAELTANLVVKQFEETEKVLHRFQVYESALPESLPRYASYSCTISEEIEIALD